MTRFIFLLLMATTLQAESPYQSISARNAFDLTSENPAPILPPITEILPLPDIYLTGITQYQQPQVHLMLEGAAGSKYLSLSKGQKKYNITAIKILKNSALIDNNGTKQHLTFKANSLPSIILKAPSVKSSVKASRSSSKDIKKASPTVSTPRPQIVTVPSRRPKIDPRIIEKGLEYLTKTENDEKKRYILERLEGLQSGQTKIDNKIDSNERRRRYDEYRKQNNKRE
jgi:hypothetical protein